MANDIISLANEIAAEKENIRQAINTAGVDCPEDTPLKDYAGKISSIQNRIDEAGTDICYAETKSGTQKFIIIHNHIDWSLAYGVCSDKWRLEEDILWAYSTIRPATEDEKQQLFDALAKEGKRWNAEKKVVEDIPKPYEFKKGEPVLVRKYGDEVWKLAAFSERHGDPIDSYEVRNERGTHYCFRYCIPYNERTMHLLGSTEDYKEE